MLPWGHAAAGYLLYVIVVRARGGNRPEGPAVLVLAFGTQFADLVDKPLAWYFGILPAGRSLGHSLLIAIVLLTFIHVIAVRYDRQELSIAFAVGHLSHLAADAYLPLLRGQFAEAAFLLWPPVPLPPEATAGPDRTLLEILVLVDPTSPVIFQHVLVIIAAGVWIRQGMPGVETLQTAVVNRTHGP